MFAYQKVFNKQKQEESGSKTIENLIFSGTLVTFSKNKRKLVSSCIVSMQQLKNLSWPKWNTDLISYF